LFDGTQQEGEAHPQAGCDPLARPQPRDRGAILVRAQRRLADASSAGKTPQADTLPLALALDRLADL